MEKVFEKFLEKVITKEDFILLLEEINSLERFIFKETKKPLSEKIKGEVREEFRNIIEKLEKEKIITRSPDQQFSFFDNFKKYLKNIPQLKLEIAFLPSEEFLLDVKNWFKKEKNKEVILDLTVNPKLVAGAIIEYEGRYGNFSIAKKIDELFSNYEKF